MADPGDDLLAQLTRWAADQRVAEAAAGRSRTRSLLDQMASTATWEGILLDLAEQRARVDLTIVSTRASGHLVGVGRDFVALEQTGGLPLLVRTDALTSLSAALPTPRARRAAGGGRPPAVGIGILDALEALVGETAPIRVLTDGPILDGDAVALGQDVLTLRERHGARRLIHAPLGGLNACELR